jgi:hypothetical protein
MGAVAEGMSEALEETSSAPQAPEKDGLRESTP